MDQTVNNEPVKPQSDGVASSVGEKRPIENVENGGLTVQLAKKPRCGPGDELKRVAEIVLVLSAIGRMRGGRKDPTDAELGLMAEARAKLAEMCQEFAPKDIVGRDAIGAVIEDLGLNGKLKDQRLGFRGPKLTISEKLSLAKRKMEESKKFTAPSPTLTSHSVQPGLGAAAGRPSHLPIGSATHMVRMLPSDKPGHAPVSSGGFPASSPQVHVTAATNTSLPHQLPTGEIKTPTVSTGLPSGHFTKDSLALPRVERPQIKLDGGSNGSTNASQIPAISSANHPLVDAPTWSVQSQSTLLTKSAVENKVPNHNPVKHEGSADLSVSRMAQAVGDQSFRPFITQTSPGSFPGINQPMQGMNFVHTSPFGNNHNEIAKIVHKLLQPQLPQRPTWTPPSREYMNKALTCQMCKVTINEVDTVLICDACEKGFHLKCLQSNNLKGIPKPEWHCTRCMQLCNGKPLPPKYGRVMRSIIASKVPPNTAGVQSPSEKKSGTLDLKDINQQKITANGSPGLQSPAGSGTVSRNCAEPSESKTPNTREMLGNNLSLSKLDMGQRISVTCPHNPKKSLEAVCASVAPSGERSNSHTHIAESSTHQEKPVSESEDSKAQPPAMSSDAVSKSDHSQPLHNMQNVHTEVPNCAEVPLDDETMLKDSEKTDVGKDGDNTSRTKEDQQVVAQENPVGSSGSRTEDGKHKFSSEGSDGVEWIGDAIQVVDGKKSFQSCRIKGIMYKVQDHALFRSSHDKLIPSKLQAMWEDIKTGLKWVVVNRFYFPNDFPEAGICPSTPESSEVYKSNNDSTIMAGLIQGPCEVLPAPKFKEESERRSQFGTEANKGSSPVFLCKWFYDEFKGIFQPVSS